MSDKLQFGDALQRLNLNDKILVCDQVSEPHKTFWFVLTPCPLGRGLGRGLEYRAPPASPLFAGPSPSRIRAITNSHAALQTRRNTALVASRHEIEIRQVAC